MAYDPNDPKDKEIVDGLIDAALEAAREEHQTEVDSLKGKNTELLGKLKKAREGKEDAGEVARLESELETASSELREAQSKLRTVERDLKKVTGERDSAVTERDTERNFSRSQLIENSLNSALNDVKVAPHFMDAAKALLSKSLTVEVEGDNRLVKADGKDVGEFVKEWAASDAGKHYVIAAGNAGGGATGPNGTGSPTGLKKLDDYSETERADMAKNRPEEWKQVLASANQPIDNAFVIQ